MSIVEYVFWGCLLLVAHTYVLYPLFLFAACSIVQVTRDWRFLRSRRERRVVAASTDLPAVTLVIPAYNEEARLADKLANIRMLDYPADRLEVVFVSDGSSDGTNGILAGSEATGFHSLVLPARGGKASALNQGVARARHEILVFSDAATLLAPDAIRKLVRHFADPRVGVVCGALQFQATAESRQTEGVYWTYESMLRLMEARLGATLTASGALYALRRGCYLPLSADMLVEDLLIPMNARRLGFLVRYDPEAVGTDYAASTVAGEFTRRVRVATGSFLVLRQLAGIRLGPMTAFAFVSHKLLRWVLPFLLIGLIAASVALSARPVYRVALGAQVVFYTWAGLGYVFRRQIRGIRYALIPYYLLAIHMAFLVGFVRAMTRKTEAAWQRVN